MAWFRYKDFGGHIHTDVVFRDTPTRTITGEKRDSVLEYRIIAERRLTEEELKLSLTELKKKYPLVNGEIQEAKPDAV